jgi:tRNA(Ile)-lysidine synthase
MIIEKFNCEIRKLKISKNERFLVALSGGIDSTALLVLCKKLKLNFEAVIVDHGYRRESTKESKEIKKYLEEKLKVKITILANKKPVPKTAVEEFLRKVRYDIIFSYCKKNNISKIFMAHHLDDQIETFLMRLERGSGLDGLVGMKTSSQFTVHGSQFEIIRPLLKSTKQELKNYLQQNKIKWWEDKTNQDKKLTRNNIRATLQGFSDYELIRKRLSGVIENIERAKDFIEQEKENNYRKIVIEGKNTTINLIKYRNLHEEIRLRILRDIIKKYSKTKKDIRLDAIKILDNNLLQKSFKKAELQGVKIYNSGLYLAEIK